MSGSALGYNILTDASAAFAAHTIRQPKTDGGAAVSEADTDDYPGAVWFNEVDDQLILLSQAVQGDAQVAAWDVLGTLDVDGAAVFGGNVTMDSASPTATVGDGTGGGWISISKADGSSCGITLVEGTDYWALAMLNTEDCAVMRYVGGVYQDSTIVAIADSKWTFPAEIEIDGDLNHDGPNVGFFGTAPAAQAAAYTVTNHNADRSYDCDATSTAELADVLGSVIVDLQSYGLLQ